VQSVLQALRQGQVLHRSHSHNGGVWFLTNGRRVTDEVAQLVITDVRVIGCDDRLFVNTQQTFKYVEN